MTASDHSVTVGLDRWNALFAWWSVPSSGGNVEGQMKRLQSFAADLQKTYSDAYSQQMEGLFAANERLGRSLQELMHCSRPQDILAAESKILTSLFEGASLQAKAWIDLTQKIQGCCTAMVREEAVPTAKEASSPQPRVETRRPATKQASKQLEHA